MLLIILGWAPVCFTMNNFDKDERATQVNSATPSDDSSSKFNQESPTTQTDQRTELKNTSQSNKRRLLPMPNPKTPPSPISATTEQTETFPSKAEPVEASSFRPISTSKTNQTDASPFRQRTNPTDASPLRPISTSRTSQTEASPSRLPEDVASPIQMFSPIHQPQIHPEQFARLKHAEEHNRYEIEAEFNQTRKNIEELKQLEQLEQKELSQRHEMEKQFEQKRSSQEERFNQTGLNIETNRKQSEEYQEELRQEVISATRVDIKTGKTVEKVNRDHNDSTAKNALIRKFSDTVFNFNSDIDIQAVIRTLGLNDKDLITKMKRCDTAQKKDVLNALIRYFINYKIHSTQYANAQFFEIFKNILKGLTEKFQTLFMNKDQELKLVYNQRAANKNDTLEAKQERTRSAFDSLEYTIIIKPLPQLIQTAQQNIRKPVPADIAQLNPSLLLQPDPNFSNPNDFNSMKEFFNINNEPTNNLNEVKNFLSRHNISVTNLNLIKLFLYLNDVPTINKNVITHFLNAHALPATDNNFIEFLLRLNEIPQEILDQINQFRFHAQPQMQILAPPAAKTIGDPSIDSPLLPQSFSRSNQRSRSSSNHSNS